MFCCQDNVVLDIGSREAFPKKMKKEKTRGEKGKSEEGEGGGDSAYTDRHPVLRSGKQCPGFILLCGPDPMQSGAIGIAVLDVREERMEVKGEEMGKRSLVVVFSSPSCSVRVGRSRDREGGEEKRKKARHGFHYIPASGVLADSRPQEVPRLLRWGRGDGGGEKAPQQSNRPQILRLARDDLKGQFKSYPKGKGGGRQR